MTRRYENVQTPLSKWRSDRHEGRGCLSGNAFFILHIAPLTDRFLQGNINLAHDVAGRWTKQVSWTRHLTEFERGSQLNDSQADGPAEPTPSIVQQGAYQLPYPSLQYLLGPFVPRADDQDPDK